MLADLPQLDAICPPILVCLNLSGGNIDKLYTQIGNVNRLHNIIEPFAALFWALGIVLAHILQ